MTSAPPTRPDEFRLHRALAQLKGFRRQQLAEELQSVTIAVSWSTQLAGIAICLGLVSLVQWPVFPHSLLVGAVCFLALLGVLAGRGIPWTVAAIKRLASIPSILFCETRMHLLELVLIVALLGHGVGMIVGLASGSDAVFGPAALCLLWSALVFGGAAWGLWVAQTLNEESAFQRCALILIGFLSPLGLVGLIGGLAYALSDLPALPLRPAEAYVPFGGALLVTAAALYVLGRAYHHQNEVRHVLQARRLRHARARFHEGEALRE